MKGEKCVKTGCDAPAIGVVSYWHTNLLLPEMLGVEV
jgi:hypothetical protein